MKYYYVEAKGDGADKKWIRNQENVFHSEEDAFEFARQQNMVYRTTDYRVVCIKYKEEIVGKLIH